MTWPIDVNQSLSTATPVFAQWLKNSVQGHSDGSTKVKPHGRTFSKGDLASEHYCWICSLSRLEMKAESLVWHHFPGPATHLVTNWHVEFLYLIKGSNLCSVEQTLQFSSGQLLSRVRLFVTPWTAARQASLSITNSQSWLKLMSIESVMPSKHLILCHSLLLPPSIFPSIRVFSSWVTSSHQVAIVLLEHMIKHIKHMI